MSGRGYQNVDNGYAGGGGGGTGDRQLVQAQRQVCVEVVLCQTFSLVISSNFLLTAIFLPRSVIFPGLIHTLLHLRLMRLLVSCGTTWRKVWILMFFSVGSVYTTVPCRACTSVPFRGVNGGALFLRAE